MGDPVPAAELGPLAPLAERQVTVRRATVVSDALAEPLVDLEVADSAAGPVLVDWEARIDDPFLTLAPSPHDIAALAPVLKRHMPADGRLLGWWDTSRQLRLLADMPVVFGEHLGLPLFVPDRWRSRRASIESIERGFWKAGEDTAQRERFQRFADALLADETQGMAELRALADGRPSVLVLHARDAILLGQMSPRSFGVAFRDFGAVGDVHGMVRRVHAWLDENRYPAYTVLQDKEDQDQSLRAIALTDEASGRTLAARLLPFMGNDQHDVEGATLVYRVGGFVVYELAGDPRLASSDAAGR